MQFEAVAYRLFLHYSYTLAQKASNYGIFCFYYNKINNIRDYDVERSETSSHPSTGNKFDAVLDGFLSDTGSASFIDTPKKRAAPSDHCRGTNSFARSEFGFNGELPF
jgi:hypothetical protein